MNDKVERVLAKSLYDENTVMPLEYFWLSKTERKILMEELDSPLHFSCLNCDWTYSGNRVKVGHKLFIEHGCPKEAPDG